MLISRAFEPFSTLKIELKRQFFSIFMHKRKKMKTLTANFHTSRKRMTDEL